MSDLIISKTTLSEWVGFELTDAEVERLSTAIPHSTVPEAVATIADSFRSFDQES